MKSELFYSTAATVLPLLVLTIYFGAQSPGAGLDGFWTRLLIVVGGVWFLAAEGSCFAFLIIHPKSDTVAAVLGSVVLGALGAQGIGLVLGVWHLAFGVRAQAS